MDDKGDEVWVYSFGGYATEASIIKYGFELMSTLKGDGREVDESVFYYAQYDKLTRLIGRHNEIWVYSKEKEE